MTEYELKIKQAFLAVCLKNSQPGIPGGATSYEVARYMSDHKTLDVLLDHSSAVQDIDFKMKMMRYNGFL